MSKDSKNKESYFESGSGFVTKFHNFAWKISKASMVSYSVDYVLQSPSFSYKGSTWILKMYPYGQTKYKTQGYIDIIIERLHSQHEEQYLSCEMYCEDAFSKELNHRSGCYCFEPHFREAKILHYMQSLKECPEKEKFILNDVFTFVFGFLYRKFEEEEQGITDVGETSSESTNGHFIKDYLERKDFQWKIVINRLPVQFTEDYQLLTQPFSFANASWMLKIYPYFKMKHSSKQSFDVVLHRLQSEISEQYIKFKIRFSSPSTVVDKFYFFDSYNAQGDAISFQLDESSLKGYYFLIKIEMSMKNNDKKLNSLSKLYSSDGDNTFEPSMDIQKTKILQNLKKLYLNQEDCDIIINVKGQEFPAHSIILKAQSPVFASTLRTDMKEKVTGIIDVEDCDPSTFSDFLCFLYCGEIGKLSVENVFSLFTAADKYDISGLRTSCLEFMKQNITINTFCDIIALALLHSEAELIKSSTDFFAKNLQDIIVTVKWQSFLIENPIQGNELLIKALVPKKE